MKTLIYHEFGEVFCSDKVNIAHRLRCINAVSNIRMNNPNSIFDISTRNCDFIHLNIMPNNICMPTTIIRINMIYPALSKKSGSSRPSNFSGEPLFMFSSNTLGI